MTENDNDFQKKNSKKSNNNFFLITFIISLLTIALTWTPLATKTVGITDILPHFCEVMGKKLVGQGLSIFAFAFFLYAIFKSRALQALFSSQIEWLKKRKYLTITLITFVVALLSSNLSWFDEFVHFYPLIIPLMMAMGFDTFSSILCLYGGSITGLMGMISSERMREHFGQVASEVKNKVNYSGFSGIGFRLITFALFVSIIILFNVWYCSRNEDASANKREDITKEAILPKFNRTRKIVLAVAGFFFLGAIFAQVPVVAKTLGLENFSKKIPKEISNHYEERKKYQYLGKLEKMDVAEEEEKTKKNWGVFGNWEEKAINCWLIIGGIIICLITQQSIIGNLTTAMKNGIPLVLIYAFAAVPAQIMKVSGISDNLAKMLLPNKVMAVPVFLLLFIFGVSILLTFLVGSTTAMATSLVGALAPTLLAFSESTFIYATLFSWIGAILGMAFSPNNGILRASLGKGEISYKQFIKKVWVLGLNMFIAACVLVGFWIYLLNINVIR
jgi:uncharacterized ion transporter superfamily protein YfcC